MPILVNQEGLAVDLPQQQADAALQQGTHYIPLIGPEGPTSASLEEASRFIAEGYKQPEPAQLKEMLQHAKYASTGEQVKAFAERTAAAGTLGLSTGIERLAGVKPEDIRGRREVLEEESPLAAVGADVLGFAGTIPLGAGKAVIGAGQAARALSPASKLGATMLQQATEMAIIQGGDEVSKALMQDPNQTYESAAANVGLSAALGGALGAAFVGGEKVIAPIWKATKAPELARYLTTIRNKAQSTTGASALEQQAREAGVELTPSVRAMLGSDEGAALGASLRENATKGGKQVREELEGFFQQANDQALSALGRSKKDIAKVGELSEYELGSALKKSVATDLKASLDPLSKEFEKVSSKLASKPMPAGAVEEIAERVNKIMVEGGHTLRSDSDAAKLLKSIQKDLPNIKTLEDFRKFQTTVREDLSAKGMYGVSREVMPAFRDLEETFVERAIGLEAPELLASHKAARAGYRDFMQKAELLNDRLRVGKFYGPDSFIRALGELAPEDVVRRLSLKGDVDLIKLLGEVSPGTLEKVRSLEIDRLLKRAAEAPRAMEGGLDTRVLFKELEKMSPEMRKAVFSQEQLGQLESVKALLEKLPERINPSGTARSLDEKFLSSSGGFGMLGAILTGGSVWGGIAGYLAAKLGREVPDAIKLSMLKVLGSEGPIDAVAFKGMVNYIDQVYKAAHTTDKVVRNIFKPVAAKEGAKLIEPVSPRKVAQLDEQIQQAALAPEQAMENVSTMSSYLPDAAVAAGEFSARAVGYLNSIRPQPQLMQPLDPEQMEDPFKRAEYERALVIAERPITVLESIREGTLTPQDVIHIKNLYPALYNQYQRKLLDTLGDAKAKGTLIPYDVTMTLGLFLGMPLESSQLPQNIMLNASPGVSNPQSMKTPPQGNKSISQGAVKPLMKGVEASLTPGQSRMLNKAQR